MDISHLATIAGWLSHARDLLTRVLAAILPHTPANRHTHVRLSVGRGWLVWERDCETSIKTEGPTNCRSKIPLG